MKDEKRLLLWILVGSSGGLNRVLIIEKLFQKPYNANELCNILNLDYKTIRHHLKVLQKNRLIISSGEDYGKVYLITEMLERNYEIFKEIWSKIGKK